MSLAEPGPSGTHAFPCVDKTLRMVLLPSEAEGADRLVQRLCLSFVNYATACHDRLGQIRFPFGWCKLEAQGTTLEITVGAEDLAGLDRVEELVVDRLNRLARRQRRELMQKPARLHVAASDKNSLNIDETSSGN